MIKEKIDIQEVREFTYLQDPNTKLYVGCDSEYVVRNGVRYVDYITVVVVHIGSAHGCKIFGQIEREQEFKQRGNSQTFRLMNEVYKVADMYNKLVSEIGDYEIEAHLDLNRLSCYASNAVVQQAMGYIRGVCRTEPQIKPNAFAASAAADMFKLKVLA